MAPRQKLMRTFGKVGYRGMFGLGILSLGLVGVGCPTPPPAEDQEALPGNDPDSAFGNSVSRTIGPDGGFVAVATGASLDVPAGALGEETSLTIAVGGGPGALPMAEGAGEVHEFTPHCLSFEESATVRLPYSPTIPPELEELVTIYWSENPDGPWRALPTVVDRETKTATAQVSSFSYGIAGVSVTDASIFVELERQRVTKVDLLFVVDNSRSMSQEQEILSDQVRVMVQELIAPTAMGGQTPPAVQDLHIGVVSTDLGADGQPVDSCVKNDETGGDKGLLQATGRNSGCLETYVAADCTSGGTCPWLVHSDAHPDDDVNNAPIWEDFKCIAALGTGGCGFEQPLEASRRALDPAGDAVLGGTNAGFLRSDSLLAVIYVTDEDDCSASDTRIFDPGRDSLGALNLRCANNGDLLVSVEEYYNFFVNELRGGVAQNVVMAAIVGLPELPLGGESWEVGDLVAELEALEVEDPDMPWQLLPVCESESGVAFPPTRIAQLANLFGDAGSLHSICQNDWAPALRSITRQIQSRLDGTCWPESLDGHAASGCTVIETMNSGAACPHLANQPDNMRTEGWHQDWGIDADGRRQCLVLPADYDNNGLPDGPAADSCSGEPPFADCLAGWYYDSDNDACSQGAIRFTAADLISEGSTVEIVCPR
jgi:hypothetical protein